MPVWGGMSGLHVWFYRINKNILPLSYGEVWAAQINKITPMKTCGSLAVEDEWCCNGRRERPLGCSIVQYTFILNLNLKQGDR